MLRVRKKQMDSLAVLDFEDATLAHLGEFFPRHLQLLGEERLRALIRHGLDRARSHGLVAERSARYYVDLMCLLGSGFDADPQLPWARAVLEDPSLPDEEARIDFLHDRASGYIERISVDLRALLGDPQHARFFEEIHALTQEPNEPWSPGDTLELERRMAARLRRVFPAKSRVLGGALVRDVAARGVALAGRHGLGTPRGAFLCAAMMFVVGSGFDADPQLPWVAEILGDPLPAEPAARVDRLFGGVVKFLRTWLA